MAIENGVVVDGDAYVAIINQMEARVPRRETLKEFDLTPEQYREIGTLAFGGDGFNRILHDLMVATGSSPAST